jgi:signal transduction histidine kinase
MIQENKTVLPIEVSMEMDGTSKEIVITVKDMSINEKLFSKFVTTSDVGTGLGLYVSKSQVEAHGGRIWAYNNDNEHGATFCFTLPLNP